MRTSTARSIVSLTAFGLTGVGIGLLGAVLPALLVNRHLSDASAGSLMLAAWGGSTAGTFFTRGDLQRVVQRATLLVGASLLLLAASPRPAVYPLFFLYGLGLGVMMTSINLERSRQALPEDRESELNRLNMVWALGAVASPWLAAHTLYTLRAGTLFCVLGAVFFACALALSLTRDTNAITTVHAPRWRDAYSPIPLTIAAAAVLAVGAESAVGGWLTTYAQRTAGAATLSVSATSAFWAGLLLSRALRSSRRLRGVVLSPARAALLHCLLAVIAQALLLAFAHRAGLPLLAMTIGFGLGPLYPYVLSVALPRFPGNTVFLSAGIGSALLPWLTGTASAAAGSLRGGLLVPCLGSALLLPALLFIPTAKQMPALEPQA